MWFLLFAIGFVLGALVILLSTVGTLKIDHSNPEKDVYRFEIDDIDKLSKRKRVVLKVDNKADLSQD